MRLQDPNLRQLILERSHGLCGFCGRDVTLDWMDIDHIIPRALGGPDHIDNLRAAHPNCNRRAAYAVRQQSQSRFVVPLTMLHVDLPLSLKFAIRRRADREKRSTNAEIQAMLEWALVNMPEQLPPRPSTS